MDKRLGAALQRRLDVQSAKYIQQHFEVINRYHKKGLTWDVIAEELSALGFEVSALLLESVIQDCECELCNFELSHESKMNQIMGNYWRMT